ncbi:MAG: hypothetical protein AAFR52_06035 [Pseudomonadota bacterium]
MSRSRTTGALSALCMAAVLGGTPASGGSLETAQLPQGDPARKLMMLHFQEVNLAQMVASVCYVDAGVQPDKYRVIAYASRDRFDNTLPDIVEEAKRLDPNHSSYRQMQRQLKRKARQWKTLKRMVEGELEAEHPSPDVLARMSEMVEGLEGTIEKTYRMVKKKMQKEGLVDQATLEQEQATFNLAFSAKHLMSEACLVAQGAGGSLERAKLFEAVERMERELLVAVDSPLVGDEVKALVPAWQAMTVELRALAGGAPPASDLLIRLDALQDQWEASLDIPGIGHSYG